MAMRVMTAEQHRIILRRHQRWLILWPIIAYTLLARLSILTLIPGLLQSRGRVRE